MDSRVAVQEYGTGEFGTVAIDTGIANSFQTLEVKNT
jgi:hypothetical protein